MPPRDFLGEFEHIVLLALLRLGDDAYGVTVRREIESRIDRDVSLGAVYATLDRLQSTGTVRNPPLESCHRISRGWGCLYLLGEH